MKLPDETLVYPAHDYKGETVSTIGEDKFFNPRLKVGCGSQICLSRRGRHRGLEERRRTARALRAWGSSSSSTGISRDPLGSIDAGKSVQIPIQIA